MAIGRLSCAVAWCLAVPGFLMMTMFDGIIRVKPDENVLAQVVAECLCLLCLTGQRS